MMEAGDESDSIISTSIDAEDEDLVEEGFIERRGGGRSTYYVRKD